MKKDIEKADNKLPVDMSLSSDPYPPIEKKLRLTRRVLELLVKKGFKVQITTKSDLFLNDMDIIERFPVVVSVTITTLDNSLASKIEPFAPTPKNRIIALEKLGELEIPFSVRIDPVIPYLNDDEKSLREIVKTVASIGAKHIVTSTYKAKPDNFKRMIKAFPELEKKWMKLYYPRGKLKLNYAYAPIEFRKKALFPVVDEAKKEGLTYATCRENLLDKTFFNAPSCDGTHLLKQRIMKTTRH